MRRPQTARWRGRVVATLIAIAMPGIAAAEERVSTLADQRAIGVTIYNADLALVRDRRRITLPRGESRIAVRDVSAALEPESALFAAVGSPRRITVLEQNFDYDVLSPYSILTKSVGRDVNVIRYDARTGRRHSERARLIATNNGVVLRYPDRIETSPQDGIAFGSLPASLRDRPTLVTDVRDAVGGPQNVELTYLTRGLSWQADYTALLSSNDDRLSLHGLVTLRNHSGTTYRNARVQLVAGDVNVVMDEVRPGSTADRYSINAAEQQKPKEEALLDYHLYTLPRQTTVADNQTKQVLLLRANNVPLITTLELDGSDFYYRERRGDLGQKLKVTLELSFRNAGGDLGIPLPGGTIRVFKRDNAGRSQFVGSDTIDHTPKNETVRLTLGSSFDVTASKQQTDWRDIRTDAAGTTCESSYAIVLRNAKTIAQTVLVVEPIPGDWKMLASSAPFTKTSASTASWSLRVPPGGSTTLTYRVRTIL